jgi:hypothetical protein
MTYDHSTGRPACHSQLARDADASRATIAAPYRSQREHQQILVNQADEEH